MTTTRLPHDAPDDALAQVAAAVDRTALLHEAFAPAIDGDTERGTLLHSITNHAMLERVLPVAWKRCGMTVTLVVSPPWGVGHVFGWGTAVDWSDGPGVDSVASLVDDLVSTTVLGPIGNTRGRANDFTVLRRSLAPATQAATVIAALRADPTRARAFASVSGGGSDGLLRNHLRRLGTRGAIGRGLDNRPPRTSQSDWDDLLRIGAVVAAVAGVTTPLTVTGGRIVAYERRHMASAVTEAWHDLGIDGSAALLPPAHAASLSIAA